jgi:Trp operon repressor
MVARIVNNKFGGLFEEIFIEKNQEKKINGAFVSEWQLTDVLPSENLLKPQWNGTEWIEGATTEELQTIQNQKKETAKQDIANLYTQLYRSALSRATGKTGTLEYLLLQKKEYEDKYKCAMEVINNQPISNQFMYAQIDAEKEFEDFADDILFIKIGGINQMITNPDAPINYPELIPTQNRIKDFCQIIKFMFETNEFIYQNFMKMIVFMRTRMITDVELGNLDNYNNRLSIVNEVLAGNLSNKELQQKFVTFQNM